jgi:hypothetical protein
MAPEEANAGHQIEVMAEIVNQGTGDAGPFTVQFFYANGNLAPLGTTSVRCAVAGLSAGAEVVCNGDSVELLDVPLVADDRNALVAQIDPAGAVMERDEGNNSAVLGARIHVLGGVLEQQLYRAEDGTAYQLIRVVPRKQKTSSEEYRLTTLAGSVFDLTVCSSFTGSAGSPTSAVVGSDPNIIPPGVLHPFDSTRRTEILLPTSTDVRFQPRGGGILTLGSGVGTVDVCHVEGECPQSRFRLFPLGVPDFLGVPAACIATSIFASCTSSQLIATTFAASSSGTFCDLSAPTVNGTTCGEEPSGLTLLPGQSIVFVYDSLSDALKFSGFSVGMAGFGIDRDGENDVGCKPGQIVDARALDADSAPPVLPAENDDCEDAIILPTAPYFDISDTRSATTEPEDPVPSCVPSGQRARSVWYRYTAPLNGATVRANVFGSNYSPIISLYSGSCGTLTPVPDACGSLQIGAVPLVGGETYFFMVSAPFEDGGTLFFDFGFTAIG